MRQHTVFISSYITANSTEKERDILHLISIALRHGHLLQSHLHPGFLLSYKNWNFLTKDRAVNKQNLFNLD